MLFVRDDAQRMRTALGGARVSCVSIQVRERGLLEPWGTWTHDEATRRTSFPLGPQGPRGKREPPAAAVGEAPSFPIDRVGRKVRHPKPMRSRVACLVIGALLAPPGCTAFVQPTFCEAKATRSAGIHDARFSDIVATAVEGADGAGLGLVPSQHFCVVTRSAFIHSDFAVKDRDCRVLRYEDARSSWDNECPVGAPVFVTR